MNDLIERDLLLPHPVERVWAALTDPKELGTWFPDHVELDVRPGGEGTFTFDMEPADHVAAVVVEAVEPMERFAFWWGNVTDDPGDRTLVEFTLAPAEGGTRLRLVESGFASLSDGATRRAGNIEGWQHQLEDLQKYLG